MDLEQRLKEYQKTLPDGTAYIWYSDVPRLIGEGTPSLSSFRRRMNEGKLHTIAIKDQGQAAFLASDILKFLRGDLTKPRGAAAYRGKTTRVPAVSKASSSALNPPLVSIASPDDLPHIFSMEYTQVEMGAASPHALASWLSRNNEVYWLLSDPADRKDVWATLCALPLADDVIFRLLHGKMSLNEVSADSIQIYESGKTYSCYLSAIVRPDRQELLTLLISHVFGHWSKQSFTIKSLYVLSHGDESPVWQKTFYFSPLCESNQVDRNDYAWQLRLDFPNPSIDVQKLKRQEETMISIPIKKARRTRERVRNLDLSHFRSLESNGATTGKAAFCRARTSEDLWTIMRINDALFPPTISSLDTKYQRDERIVGLMRSWWERNPETFHVLLVDGKVVGFLSLLPLPLETINKLVSSQIKVRDIPLDDVLPYTLGQPINIFIQTLAVDPAFQSNPHKYTTYGSWLGKGVMSMFYELGNKGIEVSQIFARSDTPDGAAMCISLGFEEVPAPEGVHKRVFVMDLIRSDRPFPTQYRYALAKYRKSHTVSSDVSSKA